MKTTASFTALGLLVLAGIHGPAVADVATSKAQALRPGDTIAVVAPASPLDRARVERATERLEELGYRVKHRKDLFRSNDYLAGSDKERADELLSAFADPDVNAVFPGTGGYGTTRLLDLLDFDVIRKNPKVLVGFSDITALHVAIFQRTGLITFHSPNPQYGLGSPENLAPIAGRYFWRAILAEEYLLPGGQRPVGYVIHTLPTDSGVPMPTTLVEGKASGRLIGGNLSLVHALMGTPYEVETEGRILFLEDVGEAPYRVDRMLQTLKSAGKFDKPAGVVLGAFTRRKGEDTEGEIITIDEVLRGFFASAPYPVLADFPVGHQRNNVTLPVGALSELDAKNKTLRLLENPVAVPRPDRE